MKNSEYFYTNGCYQISNFKNSLGRVLDLVFCDITDNFNLSVALPTEHFFENSLHHKALILEYRFAVLKCVTSNLNVLRYDLNQFRSKQTEHAYVIC